ncbi:hypothetical protein FAES_3930 [Fibrella aestuarina BUZ 2]|uniref:dATP/dGTP diphosphohydrolase MazZ domain-containing protein n=1 Tax=Fibrella aestuarina BUZ 2 TaxID=1166018 RepID=I0KCT3_9BACT|nr:dATP/dGTP pyrophosphohydrolase domain-containing protein [Fibrella aestuarina]CCH01936.1 hypothetical protein FAES_3930 [Fibrella aestuarina BUZ 2]
MNQFEFQDRVDGSINDYRDGAIDGAEFREAIVDTLLEAALPVLQPITLEEVEAKRSAWARATFPGTTPLSSLRHLEREIEEIEADIVAGKDPTVEYADALSMLLDSAGQAGIGPRALIDAMHAKLLINQTRDWTQNPDGSYAHIEPQPSC